MNVISYTNAGKRQHGENHWCWAVWIDAEETQDRQWNHMEPNGSGFCSSKPQARQAAWIALKALGHDGAYRRRWASEYLWERLQKDSRPIFSRCKISEKRWLWVVFQSCLAYDVDPLAHGIAGTSPEALGEAEGACGPVRESGNYLAEHFRMRQNALRRSAKPTSTSDTAALEFVYECHADYSDFDGRRYDSITPHRIVKRTKKRIYVDRHPYQEQAKEIGDRWDYVDSTFILDRAQFEATGKARRAGRVWNDMFYADSEIYHAERRSTAYRADCFVHLGVPAGATKVEIQSAYRRLAQRAHPDAGGDAEEFKKVHTWYEQAMALAK